MIKQFTICLFTIICCSDFSFGQESYPNTTSHSFIEWNVGIAAADNFTFPGTSVLWGATVINENNSIFEYEAGLAFPTLLTGKMGGGKVFGSTKIVIGVRPFPFNFYLQTSFLSKENGYWILSFEYNPFDDDAAISFGSKGIVNIGYRWHRD